MLEGGYNISAIIISSFEQSVFTHARFLNLSLNMFQINEVKLTGVKREEQDNIDDDNGNEEIRRNNINNNIDMNNGLPKEENINNNNSNEGPVNGEEK